jgi:outer membrane protein TolC
MSRRCIIAACAALGLASLTPLNVAAQGAPVSGTADTSYLDLASLVRTGLVLNLRLRGALAETEGIATFARSVRAPFDPNIGLGTDADAGAIGGQMGGLLPTGARYLLGSVAPVPLPGEPVFQNAIVASLTQPLLRGIGPQSVGRDVRAADEGVRAAFLRMERARDEVAVEIAVSYAVLVERHRQEAISARSVRRAQELLDAYTALHALERISRVDLITAELGVASRRAALLAAERDRRAAEDALVFAVYGARAASMLAQDGTALMPRDSCARLPEMLALEQATASALAERPDVDAARHELTRARYRRQFARNAALPALDVTGAVSRPLTDRGNLADPSTQEWFLGVTLSRPLRNVGATADRERALANEQRAAIALEELENAVRGEVRAALRDLSLGRQQAELAAEAARLANAQYAGERERLDLGLSDIFRLLQYDEQVARVEQADARAQLALAVAGLQYRIAAGRVANQLDR